jgi:hypothetical protein
LEDANVAQVAAEFDRYMGRQIDNCVALLDAEGAPTEMLSASSMYRLISNYPYDGSSIEDYCYDNLEIGNVIEDLVGQGSITPIDLKSSLTSLAVSQLAPYVDAEDVVQTGVPLRYYSMLEDVRSANAVAREKDPTNIDLTAIRQFWNEIASSTTLDTRYLNPVILNPAIVDTDELFPELRRIFPLSGQSYVSAMGQAIIDFQTTLEGPGAQFTPIAEALTQPSIRKIFFFRYYDEDASSNTLIVMDDQGQFWGFQIGYSE